MNLLVPKKFELKKQPKQQRTKLLVEKICKTTIELINEEGILSLNTNRVAQLAGIDVSSIYSFFPNKEAILYHIAVEWLAGSALVYERFDTDEDLLGLSWEQYFDGLIDAWHSADQGSKHNALQTVWRTYSDFGALEYCMLQIHTDFIQRHFQRYGANVSDVEAKNIAGYMFYIEDAIHEMIGNPKLDFTDAMFDLYKSQIFTVLKKVFDS